MQTYAGVYPTDFFQISSKKLQNDFHNREKKMEKMKVIPQQAIYFHIITLP